MDLLKRHSWSLRGASPQRLDVVSARGTVVGASSSCGTGSSDDARRELFAASDVALIGRRESLIAALLSTPANPEDLRRHASLPQEPSSTRPRRQFFWDAHGHTGARARGARGRRSSARCPTRGRRARYAPAPPDPRRAGARCPETGCPRAAGRGQAAPRGGRASSDAPSASRLLRARTASIAQSLTSRRDGGHTPPSRSRLTDKTRADTVETLGGPNRFRPSPPRATRWEP
jgi:hypothetical protein